MTNLMHNDPRVTTLVARFGVVERLDASNFLASIPEAEIYASGDSVEDARFMLADITAATFRLFTLKRFCLGPGPKRTLQFLERHLDNVEASKP